MELDVLVLHRPRLGGLVRRHRQHDRHPGTGNQPTWSTASGYSTQTRGYSSACAAGWAAADVTDLSRPGRTTAASAVGMGLKANNETDNLGWKKPTPATPPAGLPHINVTYAAPPPPATAPTAEVSLPESLSPTLHGVATAPGTGAESIQFYARTNSATTWNLLNGVSVAGRDEYVPAEGSSRSASRSST